MRLSNRGAGLTTFALVGFLIASMIVFSLVALPELLPALVPSLRSGTIEVQVTSTSGAMAPPWLLFLEVTVESIEVHRTGVGEGAWVSVLEGSKTLELLNIGTTSVSLGETIVGVGEYNVVKVGLGPPMANIRGVNVTLKSPAQDLKVATNFMITERKHVTLFLDLSYETDVILFSQRFDPYITVTAGGAWKTPSGTGVNLKPIASFGPETHGAGESDNFTFTIQPGSEIQNYLLHTKGGSAPEDTFDVDIAETGEFWYGLSGDLWFLGGNLTAGTYNVTTYVSDTAAAPITFSVSLFHIPRMPTDLSEAVFSGLDPATRPPTLGLNEFAVYFDDAGLYDVGLGLGDGDYEFLMNNNPIGVVTNNRTVTLHLDQGLHTFQVLGDFSGAGRDTSWIVSIVPVPAPPEIALSREAMIATALLVLAAVLLVIDFTRRRFGRRKSDDNKPTTEFVVY